MSMPQFDDETYGEINVFPHNFRIDYRPMRGSPGEFREVHMVDLVKRGTTNAVTPSSIKELQQNQILWPAIKPAYEAWLSGQEEPADGTPLDVVSFLPPPLIDHLKGLHIRTVQDLAAVNDADMDRIGMGARRYREKAREYVANLGASDAADQLAQMKTENDQLRADLAEMKAAIDAMAGEQAKTKSRGRPKKADDDAE